MYMSARASRVSPRLSTSSDSPSVKCCHRFGEYSAIMVPTMASL
ncbi:Uncharacterised protein [Mycobacterium tuberculosis]|nr:Uncharacterised protein [Mycobacterium tuberculosis]